MPAVAVDSRMAQMERLTQLVRRAERLALAGDWGEEAININTRILELDDRVSGAYTRLARCFREQGNWLGARSRYLQVLSFDRDNVIARNQLCVVERELQDRQYLQLVEQIDDYGEAFSIGVAARRQGDVKLAVAALRRALKIKPTSYAMNALAAAY